MIYLMFMQNILESLFELCFLSQSFSVKFFINVISVQNHTVLTLELLVLFDPCYPCADKTVFLRLPGQFLKFQM